MIAKHLPALPAAMICVLFIGHAGYVQAQDITWSRSPYLIPQTVYVGDRAMLTLPLPDMTAKGETELLPQSPGFPVSPDIEFHRIVLESRPPGCRLIIEFSAYAPGLLELPSFEIAGEYFTGITVQISSVLGKDEPPVLSGPVLPPAIPGTGLLVYGGMAALVFILLLVILTPLWVRRHFFRWLAVRKRRRLISLMAGIEKRLRKTLRGGGTRSGDIGGEFIQSEFIRGVLDTLAAETRSFLSLFSGVNCRSMTAAELGQFSPPEVFAGLPPELGGGFLEQFFRRCDDLRFGGAEIAAGAVMSLLDDLRTFLTELDGLYRRKNSQEART